MFFRFVISRKDPDSGRRQGLFQAAEQLRRCSYLTAEGEARMNQLCDWFDVHLQTPSRLAISKRAHGKEMALGWFKETASDHIKAMGVMKRLLERYGYAVQVLRAARVGYILYEDEFQIAAYPFRETPT